MSFTGPISTQYNKNTASPEDFIPLCVPELRGKEWEYIKNCLDTNWVSSVGQYVNRFEEALSSYTGTKYSVAASNGTAALHLALLVSGVGPDDEVLLSTLSFISPANAIRYTGAWPVFIDAESDYWQMDPQKVIDFIDKECRWQNNALYNKATGRRIKAVLPVHILGHPVDMDPIIEICQKYNLAIIEDATESLGAKYKDRSVGKLGDIACFSFNGNKIITSGGGGMVVTDNSEWAKQARYLSTQAKSDPVEYIHNEIGYNYRMTNIEAALGCAQMEFIDTFISAKRQIAKKYNEALKHIPGVTTPVESTWVYSSYWLYTILVDKKTYGKDSRELIKNLEENQIQTRPLWQPLHLSPAHANCQSYKCETAEKLYQQAISLPCSTGLSVGSQDKVIKNIIQAGHKK